MAVSVMWTREDSAEAGGIGAYATGGGGEEDGAIGVAWPISGADSALGEALSFGG